jgi:Dolichyl-phosphate-mannose-protein mannosyltransferase
MARRWLDRTDALLLAWTLFAKLGVMLLGVVALWMATGTMPDLLAPWHRWDAPHYTDIAIWGYVTDDPGTLSYPGYRQEYPGELDLYIVFFPLFPWLAGAVLRLVGDPIVSAFLVTTVASLFVAPMVYRLVAIDLGHRVGLRSAAFLLVFPTAYFVHIGYTEALFLALAFGSMWLARTGRWWAAGIAGGLATLTRINGLVLVPALMVEAYLQWRGHRRLEVSWLGIGLVGIGFGIYLLLNWSVYGDPMWFSEVQQHHWHKDLSPPWEGIAGIVGWIRDGGPDTAFMLGWVELGFVVLGFVATVATALWLRPTWAAWMAGNWLMIVSTGFVISVPRYSLALFGIMVWAALVAERWRVAGWILGAASVTAMAYFTWRFAVGQWAF